MFLAAKSNAFRSVHPLIKYHLRLHLAKLITIKAFAAIIPATEQLYNHIIPTIGPNPLNICIYVLCMHSYWGSTQRLGSLCI